jgi:transglutaminase-like putative cysteine protease
MPTLFIRHITTYKYRRPVAFGDHWMRLRPLDSHDQTRITTQLVISPRPKSIRRAQDVFGNHVDVAHFAGRARQLRFESMVRLEHSSRDLHDFEIEEFARLCPFMYRAEEMPDLARFIERQSDDPDSRVERWVRTFLRADQPTDTRQLLIDLTYGIKRTFKHVRRDEKGIQTPLETLKLHSGSCRDLAVLMIEAVRSLGIAARFVSGYLHIPRDNRERHVGGGNTHAWAQVYLPGPGWVDFDPSNGIVGNRDLVRVAVVRDPRQATPLHGTWIGLRSDYLGMTVEVDVATEPPEAELANEKLLPRNAG